MRFRLAALTGALLCALTIVSAASAAAVPGALAPVQRTLTAPAAASRTCETGLRSGARGVDATTYRAPMAGFVTVRSAASDRSDWDIAIFDAATRRSLVSSAGFGSHEVAQSWVTAGQRLVLQGCRRSGSARALGLTIQQFDVALPKAEGATSLVTVRFGEASDLARIESAGMDVTEQVEGSEADVLVTGAKQMAALKGLGIKYEVREPDMAQAYGRARTADAAYAKRTGAAGSPLPSGRTGYRQYNDIQNELKSIAEEHKGLVRPVVLPKKSFQGREIQGVEIADKVDGATDGRPVFFLVATHHAREWPSAETAMEFAHLLVDGYGKDARITDLLKRERVVIVPLVNPDGYIESRGEARGGLDPADTTGVTQLQTVEGVALLGGSFAYRRKNCDGAIPSGSVPCTLQYGVDPNRNYGEGWGGNGAGTDPITQSYRGTGPWSEPETQAIHEFSQSRQVTNIITLHNVAALVLRPPGRRADGKAPDEARLKVIGDQMADATGYTSQFGFQLYDTSGTTEDWNYAAQGAYGYTIEIGPAGGQFHMPYQTGVVDQWTGKPGTPQAGRGLREALLVGAEAAANPIDHGVLTGTAKAGTVLRLKKSFQTMTSPVCTYAQGYLNSSGGGTPADCVAPGPRRAIDDKLETTLVVPKGGMFTWHVNPSTRPFVGARYISGEMTPTGPAQTFKPTSGENKLALGAVDEDSGSVEREFTVGGADQLDVSLKWAVPAEDYDLKLFRIAADGSRTAAGNSGSAATTSEKISLADPAPGKYVLRVIYYTTASNDWTATVQELNQSADRVEPTGVTEAWTLTCERADGHVLGTQDVRIARGQKLALDLKRCSKG